MKSSVCAYACAYVCVCMYVCMCVCVCVCGMYLCVLARMDAWHGCGRERLDKQTRRGTVGVAWVILVRRIPVEHLDHQRVLPRHAFEHKVFVPHRAIWAVTEASAR